RHTRQVLLQTRIATWSPLSRAALLLSFFFNAPPATEIYTLSLHDALPISPADHAQDAKEPARSSINAPIHKFRWLHVPGSVHQGDRKSTRLNSSHVSISYAVFCLKKKKNTKDIINIGNK